MVQRTVWSAGGRRPPGLGHPQTLRRDGGAGVRLGGRAKDLGGRIGFSPDAAPASARSAVSRHVQAPSVISRGRARGCTGQSPDRVGEGPLGVVVNRSPTALVPAWWTLGNRGALRTTHGHSERLHLADARTFYPWLRKSLLRWLVFGVAEVSAMATSTTMPENSAPRSGFLESPDV